MIDSNNEINKGDLQKSMNLMMDQFDKFQDKLEKEKPENWERDHKIIGALKRNLSKTIINLIELES